MNKKTIMKIGSILFAGATIATATIASRANIATEAIAIKTNNNSKFSNIKKQNTINSNFEKKDLRWLQNKLRVLEKLKSKGVKKTGIQIQINQLKERINSLKNNEIQNQNILGSQKNVLRNFSIYDYFNHRVEKGTEYYIASKSKYTQLYIRIYLTKSELLRLKSFRGSGNPLVNEYSLHSFLTGEADGNNFHWEYANKVQEAIHSDEAKVGRGGNFNFWHEFKNAIYKKINMSNFNSAVVNAINSNKSLKLEFTARDYRTPAWIDRINFSYNISSIPQI